MSKIDSQIIYTQCYTENYTNYTHLTLDLIKKNHSVSTDVLYDCVQGGDKHHTQI